MPETGSAATATLTTHQLPRQQLYFTVAGLLLCLLLAALDQTIVGTAMPRVIADLQGFQHYAWVTTAYLLTSTAVVPIVGKLSDLYGRKLFLLIGAASFVGTSALCGLAQDMTQLIIFRGLQGLGGGVLTACVFTVISVLFPPANRARIQGLFSAIFGFASIVGPLIGGYLTDNLSWRWVFYVNLPIGIVALLVLWFAFSDPHRKSTAKSIDYLGAVTLVAGVVPLLLALSWGGSEYAWDSVQIIGMVALGLVMMGTFLLVENRAAEPIIPLSMFRNSVITVSSIALALMSIAMFGTILFIPLFIQGVIGQSATQSGTVLAPMMMAMILSSIASGQIIGRTGRYKLMGVGGLTVAAVGMVLLAGMTADTDYPTVIRNMVIIGLGLGPAMPVFTLAAQSAVDMRQIGVVTSLTQFARSIGGTLGVAIFGSLLANGFGPALKSALPQSVVASIPPSAMAELSNPNALLDPNTAKAMQQAFGPETLQAVTGAIKIALAGSVHDVFVGGAVVGVLGVLVTLFLKEIPLRRGSAAAAPAGAPKQAVATAARSAKFEPESPDRDEPAELVGAGRDRT